MKKKRRPRFIRLFKVILKRTKKALKKTKKSHSAFWLYVQCDDCGEKIALRIDKKTDVEINYDRLDKAGAYYILNKEIIGNKCFNMIRTTAYLNRHYEIISNDTVNGKLITKQEYQAQDDV